MTEPIPTIDDDPYRPSFLPEDEHLDPFPEEPSLETDTGIMSEWDKAYQKHIETLTPDEKFLTKEQERELAETVQAGKIAATKINNPNLSDTDKQELSDMVKSAQAARDTLVTSGLRLAAWFVRESMDFNKKQREEKSIPGKKGNIFGDLSRLSGGSLDYSDRMQIATIGLLRAAQTYNGEFRFSTWAMWGMESELGRQIFDEASLLHIPGSKSHELNNYKKVSDELNQKLQREPTIQEVADRLEIPIHMAAKLEYLLQSSQVISFEQIEDIYDRQALETHQDNPEEELLQLPDVVADPGVSTSVADEAAFEELGSRIDEVMSSLNSREQLIIELRFGLDSGEPWSLEQVGKEFGVTRERIRKIEAAVLSKLRNKRIAHQLRDFGPIDEDNPTQGLRPELTASEAINAELGLTLPKKYAPRKSSTTTRVEPNALFAKDRKLTLMQLAEIRRQQNN